VTYTNSANNNVLVKNSSGVSQAKINLLSLGTTTVSNTVDNAVLQTLGILNSSNGFNHLKSTAKDTIYSVDGTSYTASTNNGIMLSSGGVNQGTIDLKGIGTTTVSYNHTNSVLKDLGVIDNSGNYLNKRVNAQDASYSANGVSFTSSSNQILLKDNSGSSLGIVKLLKTGNVTISNTNSNEPKTLKIHAGYNYNDVFNVQLSDISTSSLGLSGLQISDSLLIDRIDGAINKVNKDQVKFGTYENTISERKDNLTTRTIDLQKSKSLIEDSNVAALYSEKIKNGILQQSTMATYKQSLDNTRLYLSLLSN
jgi:flagellin-like hook-associated protein FlgL